MNNYLIDEIVGKDIKIKTWGEMKKEFPLNENGNIQIKNDLVFSREMEYLCGTIIKIDEKIIEETKNDIDVNLENEILYDDKWYISREMIAKII